MQSVIEAIKDNKSITNLKIYCIDWVKQNSQNNSNGLAVAIADLITNNKNITNLKLSLVSTDLAR
jgi:hypothetical protein